MGGIRAQEEGAAAYESAGIREGCPGDMQGVGDMRKALLFIASEIFTRLPFNRHLSLLIDKLVHWREQ